MTFNDLKCLLTGHRCDPLASKFCIAFDGAIEVPCWRCGAIVSIPLGQRKLPHGRWVSDPHKEQPKE